MAQHRSTSAGENNQKIFSILQRCYSRLDSELIRDAIEDALEIQLKYPLDDRTDGLLYTIAFRKLFKLTKDPRRRRTKSLGDLLYGGAELPAVDDAAAQFINTETVNQLLVSCTADERKLITMRLEDKSFEAIAKITGVKKNTLEKRYTRIIAKLSKIAKKDMEEPKSNDLTSEKPKAESQKKPKKEEE
ncbi:MAG: sigma-70 family RNA polymerase sigma factor [bacterium]